MSTTTSQNCPQCGTPLHAKAGLCPRCVMAMNLATPTEFTGEEGPRGKKVLEQAPAPEELADKFPQLEILELLGRGGMGAVYKARQKQLDRIVALKILPPGTGEDPGFAERFTREAKALAKLHHPNIVTLFEFGRADGLFFFLMEFVDGVNLRQLLDTGRVSSREALAIVPQICDALQFAHDQGIVHRDIKPENILMDRRGRVKVADFGLAKLVGTEAGSSFGVPPSGGSEDKTGHQTHALTDAGKVMGTPQYMAPEQRDKPLEVDHRADIYALGVVFYQMLTGEFPGTPIERPSSRARGIHIDVRLDEVVLRALENKPELRYQQASVLKTELESMAASSGGAVGKPTHSHPRGRTPSFGDPISQALVVTVSILIAAVWGYFSDLRQGEVIWFLGRLITVPAIALGLHWLIVRYVWRAPTQPAADPKWGGSRREMSSGLVSSALAREDRGGGKWARLAGLVLILGTVAAASLFLEKSLRRVSLETVTRVEEKLRNEIESRLNEAGWTMQGLTVNVSPNLARAQCEFEFASLDPATPHPGGIRPANVVGTKSKTTGKNDLMERARKKFPASIQIRRQDQERWTVEGSGEFAFLRFSVDTSADPSATEQSQTISEWKERIAAMNTMNWRQAYEAAEPIAALPPAEGLTIVREHWTTLTNVESRQQLRKAFWIAKHPHLVPVLELSYLDTALPVQEGAFVLLRDVSLQDFSEDYNAGKAWLAEHREMLLTDVLARSARDAAKRLSSGDTATVERQLEWMRFVSAFRNKPEVVAGSGLNEALKKIINGADQQLAETALRIAVEFVFSPEWYQEVVLPKIQVGNPRGARASALTMLGRHGGDWAVDPLLQMLTNAMSSNSGDERQILPNVAGALGSLKATRAIPAMIAVIEAENTYDTIYGVGYFGLGKLTGVKYDESHDGAWWREWWEKNKQRYPAEIQALDISRLTAAKQTSNPRGSAVEIESPELLAGGDTNKLFYLIGQTNLTSAHPSDEGGHGWHGDVFGNIRRGLDWLEEQMSVAEILSAIEADVARVEKAFETGLLVDMAGTFNRINEYCDQLQGKNKNTAPSAKDWNVDENTHREILKLLAGIENHAEGMRSVARDNTGTEAERNNVLRQVSERFLQRYEEFKKLLKTARESAEASDYRHVIEIESVVLEAPSTIWNSLTPASYNQEKLATNQNIKMFRGPRVTTSEGEEATIHLFEPKPMADPRDRAAQFTQQTITIVPTLEGDGVRYSIKGHFTKLGDLWISPDTLTEDKSRVAWGAPMIYGLLAPKGRARVLVLTLRPIVQVIPKDVAEPQNAAPPSETVFDPVIERVLDAPGVALLNFENGVVRSVPEVELASGPVPADESLEEQRSGMMAFIRDGRWEIYTSNDFAELPGDAWDDVSETDITNAFNSTMLSSFGFGLPFAPPAGGVRLRYKVFDEDDAPPMNFAFRTSEGRKGVLQIVSFTEQSHPPHEIRLRYMLTR